MLCQDKLVKHAEELILGPPRVPLGRERKEGMKKGREKRAGPLAGSTKAPSLSGTLAETE